MEWFTAELLLFLLRPSAVMEPLFHRKGTVSPEGKQCDQKSRSSLPQEESGFSDQKVENHHKDPSIPSQVPGGFTDQFLKSNLKDASGPPRDESVFPDQEVECDGKDASSPPQRGYGQRGRGYVGFYVEVALSQGERERALRVVLEVCLGYGWNDVYVACDDEGERIMICEGLERKGMRVAVSEKQHREGEGNSERKRKCEVD